MARFRRFWLIIAPAAALHLSAGLVFAQKAARIPDEEEGWLKWAIAAGLGVIICITGLLNAKRSHMM